MLNASWETHHQIINNWPHCKKPLTESVIHHEPYVKEETGSCTL